MYQIRLISLNEYNEIEWERTIESPASLRGAMSKATRWIKNNLFENDYSRIDKDEPISEYSKRATWWII